MQFVGIEIDDLHLVYVLHLEAIRFLLGHQLVRLDSFCDLLHSAEDRRGVGQSLRLLLI